MRYTFSLLFGVIASMTLFWMMTKLLVADQEPVPPPTERHIIERVIVEREPPKDTQTVEPPPKPQPPPKTKPVVLTVAAVTPPTRTTRVSPVPVVIGGPTGAGTGVIAPPVVPTTVTPKIVSVPIQQPVNYPERAKARGIEGVVWIENTVDAEGNVVHVRIVESSNSVFNSAVKRSAIRWKYADSALEKRVHRTKVAFQLED